MFGPTLLAQDVHKYTTSKRIVLESPGWLGFAECSKQFEVESPGWLGFVENSKPDQTWPTGTF